MKNIPYFAIPALIVWLWFAVNGYQGIQGVVAQHVPGYPNAGQVRYYIVLPSVVATIVGISAISFWFGRFMLLAGIVQVLSLFAVLPYLFFYFGGV